MNKNDNNFLNNGITLTDKNSLPQNIMDKYRILYRDFGWYINIKGSKLLIKNYIRLDSTILKN